MYLRWTLLGILVSLLLCGAALAADPAARINPDLLIHPSSVLQPLAGTAQFIGKPGFAGPCSVTVNVTCVRTMPASERIRLEATDAYGFVISPDSVVWNAPIDSGATLSALFIFQPQEVGTYQLSITRRLQSQWQPLTALTLAVSEDGKTMYAGSTIDYRLNSIPPHPHRNSRPLTMRFPLRGTVFDPVLDRQFTGEFRFSQSPAVNDTVYVDFALECQAEQYSKVQFILDYSTNLKLSDLTRSWGDDIRLTDSSRFYSGRFWFLPLKSGIGVLNLRIVGKRVSPSRFDRATTELPIYFVTGNDGKLLLIGSFEPWTRYKNKSDRMLGGLTSLIDVKNRDYRIRHVLSKPDYQGDEMGMPADSMAPGK
ncbi:MAG: hypothetical protein E4G91_07750 [Candidatus Zixiibacteriota bacterium]|nr:MAG: hypothetical protein E4G91_07750 [candidate division Zixibacteria bacterium]